MVSAKCHVKNAMELVRLRTMIVTRSVMCAEVMDKLSVRDATELAKNRVTSLSAPPEHGAIENRKEKREG